jgi:cell division protein ZapA (FtsZ GTPase activity inhibitor)
MSKSIPLTIQGKTYQVKTDQDPAQLQMFADLVNKKMKEISNSTSVQSTMDIAILTMLNMAKDLYESEKGKEGFKNNLEEMLDRSLEKIQKEIEPNSPQGNCDN